LLIAGKFKQTKVESCGYEVLWLLCPRRVYGDDDVPAAGEAVVAGLLLAAGAAGS
jgi:hypothetical protein